LELVSESGIKKFDLVKYNNDGNPWVEGGGGRWRRTANRRKLTKPQTCVTLRKKNTRIGDNKKGEEYTIMKCVYEKRKHVNSDYRKLRGKGQREESRSPPNDLALEVAGATEAAVCESVVITRILPTPKSFRVDTGVLRSSKKQ
jgi:hypothetical protein